MPAFMFIGLASIIIGGTGIIVGVVYTVCLMIIAAKKPPRPNYKDLVQ